MPYKVISNANCWHERSKAAFELIRDADTVPVRGDDLLDEIDNAYDVIDEAASLKIIPNSYDVNRQGHCVRNACLHLIHVIL